MANKDDQDLFYLDENGKLTITQFAIDFYTQQGLDPKEMADQWHVKMIQVGIHR